MNQAVEQAPARATLRIYVACLSSYASGHLHGRWINANQTAEEIGAEVQQMLAESPMADAEETALHDHEGFEGIRLSECESLQTIAELAEAISKHGAVFAKFYGLVSGEHDTVAEGVEAFEQRYRGEYDELSDYVENFFTESGWKEDENWFHPSRFVDWERMAHDLELSGDVVTVEHDGKVHVFDAH